MATLRTGILVDTFDPVCVGHLDFCRDAMERKKLDRVVLALSGGDSVPCGASRADRWRMLVSACSAGKGFIPEDAGSSGVASPEHKYRHDKLVILSLPDGISRALCPSVSEYCSALGLYGAEPAVADAAARVGRLFAALNPHRFAHSLSVAKTSRQLARRFGAGEKEAEEAGLFHDCAKCLPLPEMQRIAAENRLTDNPDVLASGALLHSLAGAFLAEKEYGITDPEELLAIRYHNTGRAGMSRLAMCVCLADYIEPNREPFPALEETRRLAAYSLEKALLLSLESTMAHVQSKGRFLHPWTAETVAWLRSLSS